MNNPEHLLPLLTEALTLKSLPRAGWLRVGVTAPESVAAHSWGVAWLVLALCPPKLDRGRALGMAVLHDLAEVRTGDLTPHDGVEPEEKRRREDEAARELLAPLPTASNLTALWDELAQRDSPESRFVWACDKLDMALQARRYASEQSIDTAEFIRSALLEIEEPALRALAG